MKGPTRRTFAPFRPGKNANYVEVVWYVLRKTEFPTFAFIGSWRNFSQESFRAILGNGKIICQPENVSLFCGFFRFVKRINFLSTLCWAFSPHQSRCNVKVCSFLSCGWVPGSRLVSQCDACGETRSFLVCTRSRDSLDRKAINRGATSE